MAVEAGWAAEVAGVANDLIAEGLVQRPPNGEKLRWAPRRSPEDKARLNLFVPAVKACEECLKEAQANASPEGELERASVRPVWREWTCNLVGGDGTQEIFKLEQGPDRQPQYRWEETGLRALGMRSGGEVLARAPSRR